MKIIKPGAIIVGERQTFTVGWTIAFAPGDEIDDTAILSCILAYVAKRHSITVGAPPEAAEEPPSIEIERLTHDVIAQARWEPRE